MEKPLSGKFLDSGFLWRNICQKKSHNGYKTDCKNHIFILYWTW